MSTIKEFKKELGGANVKISGSIIQLLGSYKCKLNDCDVKLYAMHIGRMNKSAIALCNIESQDANSQFALTLFSGSGIEKGTSLYYPLIFRPGDFGIESKNNISELLGFARWCRNIGIKNIFINGHFGQQGSKKSGRGFIQGKNGVIVHTMDIHNALHDPFLVDSLDFINML